MGCDGGTIPRRDELVRQKEKPEQKDKNAERQYRWWHCSLTQERLREPIVMCGLGRLYCKQNIIERLLEKEKMPDNFQHIKCLKDVRDLKLTINPAFQDQSQSERSLNCKSAPYICKLIGLEMSGSFRFIALWVCGCVFSERALKEIGVNICPLCQTKFENDDIIIINGNDEDIEAMRVKMRIRNAARKNSKRKKIPDDSTEIVANKESEASSKLQKKKCVQSTLNVNLQDPAISKLKCDYSVARDPNASNVYKSIFTTHKSEHEQTRAHWVTYNPFYN